MTRSRAADAKLSPPVTKQALERPRLFNSLELLRQKPVIWVSGPAGSGKTTLVAGYLAAFGLPCVWYQLDEGDADPATFFYYLGLAAKKAAPRKSKPLPLLTPEYLPDIATFTLRFFEQLYDHLKIDSLLVFDNYQKVAVECKLHEVVNQGLTYVPRGLNVVFISRKPPPAPLTKMVANDMMGFLGWKELRLSYEEFNDIVRMRSGRHHSEQHLRRLFDVTDGWLAGLTLLLAGARKHDVAPHLLGEHAPEEVFDYLASEVFGKLDAGTQEFLLKTAFLPKISAELAGELTGNRASSHVLAELSRNNYFTIRHFQSPPTYEYHALFRNFLLNHTRKKFSSDVNIKVRCQAAGLLKNSNQLEAAVDLYGEISDWQAIAEIIVKYAQTLLSQGRNKVVLKWLDYLPDEVIGNAPWLCYWKACCTILTTPKHSIRLYCQAFEKFRVEGDSAGVFLAWSGIVEAIYLELDDFKMFHRWIEIFDELSETFSTMQQPEIQCRVSFSMFMALMVSQSQRPNIESWSEKALSPESDPVSLNHNAKVLFYRFFFEVVYKYDLKKAKLIVHELRRIALSSNAAPILLITCHLAVTTLAMAEAEPFECVKAGAAGLDIARDSGVHTWDTQLFAMLISNALNFGDIKTANDMLAEMEKRCDLSHLVNEETFLFLKGRAALLSKDYPAAIAYADSSLQLANDIGWPLWIADMSMFMAQCQAAVGNFEEAIDRISKALSISKRMKYNYSELMALLLKAHFLIEKGNKTEGLKALKFGLVEGKKYHALYNHLDQPAVTAKLCAMALQEGIEVEYVRQIIRKRNLVTDEPPLHLDNWPWSVKIMTLGGTGVFSNDEPVSFGRKAPKKPLELLKLLVALGGASREERLSDELWPDSDGDIAHQSFKTNVHRLRKLIGCPDAVQISDQQIRLDGNHCWVDAWAFENHANLMEAGLKKAQAGDDSNCWIRAAEKALDLYRGPFLENESWSPVLITRRRQLHNLFLAIVERLGHHFEKSDQFDRAVKVYESALEREPLNETYYRRLMICYIGMNQNDRATATYKYCWETMQRYQGREPSHKTKKLYNTILLK